MADELAQLRAELARLQARVDQLETEGGSPPGAPEQPMPRRNMLRAVGTAAAGAAIGGLAFARPAAAADGDNIVIGSVNNVADTPTVLARDATYTASPTVGIFHVTTNSTTNSSDLNAAFSCISAFADGTDAAGIAFYGVGDDIGAKLNAPVPLKLIDSQNSPPPTSASGTRGMIRQVQGDLWFCATGLASGTAPRQWRRLAGPSTTGALVPVTPFRVYDSRFADGPLARNENRVVSVKDAINFTTGAVSQANAIPVGAQAIVYTVTVANVVAQGNLFVADGEAAAVAGSTINWDANTVGALANSSIVKIDSQRRIKVFAGGATGSSAQFLIDISGYYL